MRILFLLMTGLLATAFADESRVGFNWGGTEQLAIQDRGRVKPFNTFAEESVLFVTGSRKWQGKGATEVVFGWLFGYEKEWDNQKFIRIDYGPLKKELGLKEDEKYFSPAEIRTNDKLPKLLSEVEKKERRKEKQTDLEKKALTLANQRSVVDAVVGGQILTLLPNPLGIEESWFPLAALSGGERLPYSQEQLSKLGVAVRGMAQAYVGMDAPNFNRNLTDFAGLVKQDLSKGAYPTPGTLSREVFYNKFRPFRWAWVLYTLSFILLMVAIASNKNWAKLAGLSTLVVAFAIHVFGFIVRCLIAGRPPVTNMYESVIWVTFGCVFFAMIIWAKYRNAVIPAASTVFAVVGLVLADNLPTALDPSINPLEPVLRSNFWLTIHVLTITLSYAAFALSLCLGNVVLGIYLFKPNQTTSIQQYTLYMYRAIQIGVVLLAAGTILGGVWADYSWGRFWGWDPKEVWALIALLLYLAVLHGRFSGWLRGFGFVATTVVSFLGVLMAWYGVNFVLGVGLHSYGFGTGGISWVLLYIGAQLAFIGVSYWKYRKEGVRTAPIFPAKKKPS